jgi:SAM-dependent methyltransferase
VADHRLAEHFCASLAQVEQRRAELQAEAAVRLAPGAAWQVSGCGPVDYQRLYEYRFRDVDQGARDAVWRPIAEFLHGRLGGPHRLLDPAAGRCEFLKGAPAAERWGVDMADYDERVGDPGIRFVVCDVMKAELPDAYFDAIFVSNFLEHLPGQEAIAAFLRRMLERLRPGGRIAVMGPNYRYCSKVYWDFADHIVPLTHLAVEEHLYAAGFSPLETLPRFLPYSFTGLLPPSPRLTAAYLAFSPAWRVLGKQFLLTAERP